MTVLTLTKLWFK